MNFKARRRLWDLSQDPERPKKIVKNSCVGFFGPNYPTSVSALVNHLFRPSHLAQLQSILEDPEASDNDRLVGRELLKNAVAQNIFRLLLQNPYIKDPKRQFLIYSFNKKLGPEEAAIAQPT